MLEVDQQQRFARLGIAHLDPLGKAGSIDDDPARPPSGQFFVAKAEILIPDVMRRRLTLTGSTLRPRSVEFKTMVADEIARTVWPYVEGGRLRPVIDSVYPLEQAAEAHARMEAGEHV